MLTLTSPRPGRVLRWVVLALIALLATVSLVVWSADRAAALEETLRTVFGDCTEQALDVELQGRATAYYLYAARRA